MDWTYAILGPDPAAGLMVVLIVMRLTRLIFIVPVATHRFKDARTRV